MIAIGARNEREFVFPTAINDLQLLTTGLYRKSSELAHSRQTPPQKTRLFHPARKSIGVGSLLLKEVKPISELSGGSRDVSLRGAVDGQGIERGDCALPHAWWRRRGLSPPPRQSVLKSRKPCQAPFHSARLGVCHCAFRPAHDPGRASLTRHT